MTSRALLLSCLSLLGFAGNSLLCRVALKAHEIDAVTFTSLRLTSGALTLWLLSRKPARAVLAAGSKLSALALFLYAAPFSYAYTVLPSGTGALILFGAVQSTMLGVAVVRGERPGALSVCGFVLALLGLLALQAPGVSAPSAHGALAMLIAGISWGVYSLRGRQAKAPPLVTTAANFALSIPLTLALQALALPWLELRLTMRGAMFALASGMFASGVGYSLWYAALPSLKASQAAVMQLLVPVIAAAGGVWLLDEPLTTRLVLCGSVIVLGVMLALPGIARR